MHSSKTWKKHENMGQKRQAPFSTWTRKEKRNATMVYKGKTITVLTYLGIMHAFLNSRYKAIARGVPVDHYHQMYIRYIKAGLPSVEEYLNLYRDATIQQQADLDAWRGETGQMDVLEATKVIKMIAGGKDSD